MNWKAFTNLCFFSVSVAFSSCSYRQTDNSVLWDDKFYPVTLFLLMLGIVFLGYRNYLLNRKNNYVLIDLDNQVNNQKLQAEAAMEQLRHINNDKDRILNVVAHDLRNPINAVISLSNIMLEEGAQPEQVALLEMMNTATNGALMLIGEILEFSGNAMQKPGGKKETAELNELLQRTVNILKFKADEKKQRIVLTLFPKQLYITTYPEKMSRVFGNLISNAIKFSQEHEVIEIDIIEKINTIVIKVTDRGIGIPEANQPLVFQIFTSAKRPGTSGEQSFGLGLSICKQIVDADNGKIWFESKPGKGSSFFVELPIACGVVSY